MAALYEHIRQAAGFVFVAGQTPLLPSGEVPDDAGEQVAVVLGKIGALLNEQSLGLEHVVKVTYFLTDIADLADVRIALDAALPTPRPSSSLVAVTALVDPRFRIEIEAIAHRETSG